MPDSFHFSFNRIVTVVFVVNVVVLLCKYNINSNADKRFGNAIKNEKRCFFHSHYFFSSDLSWTASDFCRPAWYIICAAVYLYSVIRIYSSWDKRKRRKTSSVTSTQFKPLSFWYFNAHFRLAPSVRLKRILCRQKLYETPLSHYYRTKIIFYIESINLVQNYLLVLTLFLFFN